MPPLLTSDQVLGLSAPVSGLHDYTTPPRCEKEAKYNLKSQDDSFLPGFQWVCLLALRFLHVRADVRCRGAGQRHYKKKKKTGASCEPFEKHGYAAPVLVTFGGTCVQVKAAIPVPAHLGRAASEFNFQPAASEPCAAYVYGGRRDKYANPSHVTGTPLRRSDNQIHLGVGPHPVRRGPAGQWLPGQAPVIAPGINRQAGAGEYYLPVRGQARGAVQGGEPR